MNDKLPSNKHDNNGQDVYQALKTGAALKAFMESAQADSSKRILMTQSLGNMVACEALRQGLSVGKYFMFNAAVASEAINSIYQNDSDATQDDIWFALAEYVPAVSSPVGGNSTAPAQVENHDLNGSPYRSGWGRNDGVYLENWFHSDMKDMAYFYVYPLYDELKTKGSLK